MAVSKTVYGTKSLVARRAILMSEVTAGPSPTDWGAPEIKFIFLVIFLVIFVVARQSKKVTGNLR